MTPEREAQIREQLESAGATSYDRIARLSVFELLDALDEIRAERDALVGAVRSFLSDWRSTGCIARLRDALPPGARP